jgi:RHS repeat-associated protein
MDDPITAGVTEGFGLMFYNARWYDPALGRFAQADTIVPEQTQGVQAWDRYAYTNNSPVRYTDSTGHCIDGVSTILCVMAISAIVNVAIDYAVTTYVLEEEYTAKDAFITAGISIITAGTGNFLTTAVAKSALSATAKFAAKIMVQQGVTVAGNYLQREAKGISTTLEDVTVDLIGGTFAGLISTSSNTRNIPYLDEALTPSVKESLIREVETVAEVAPVMYSGAYSVVKKFAGEKSKTYME